MQVSSASPNHSLSVSVTDGFGGAFLLWHDGRTSTTTGWDTYAQRINSDGSRLWSAEDLQITSGTGRVGPYPSPFAPGSATDGFGGALVAWGDFRNGPIPDIYAQRLAPDGSFLWQVGGAPVTTATQVADTAMPLVVPDGTGGAVIAWKTGDGNFVPQKIMAQRLSADGIPEWATGGITVADTHGNRYVEEAELISDNAGGAYITWRGSNSTTNNFLVYITRIYANGTLAPAAAVSEWMLF